MTAIRVFTSVTITQPNGEETTISETTLTKVGDNPLFFAYGSHTAMFNSASLLVTQLENRFGRSPATPIKHRKA